jgi:hypothetical protein
VPEDLPVRVITTVTGRVADLDDTWWVTKPPEVLLDMVRSLERLRSVVDLVELQVVAEIDARGAARHEGWASTKDFVTAVSGGFKGAGRRTVALARALTTDRDATARALGAGLVSRAQAEVVVGAVDRLPVDASLRGAAERLLLDEARDHDATDLARSGRHVIARLDPDGDERRDERALRREERAAHLGRFLSISDDGIGGVRLRGRGTIEDGGWLKAVLFPLAAPDPTGEPGACGGACGVASCAHDGRDPREHGARMWDALVESARLLAGTELLPESHGVRPRLTVTVDHATLVAGLASAGAGDPIGGEGAGLSQPGPGAQLDDGGTLSAGAVRRLACDAEIIPLVLGSRSQVLDVGRSSRLVTLGLWLALVARDRHCAFPACSRPPVACDAHHVTHWAAGGVTALNNLVLLCRAHHNVVHTTPWEVRLARDDGRPEFLPPPQQGRDRPVLRRRPLRC